MSVGEAQSPGKPYSRKCNPLLEGHSFSHLASQSLAFAHHSPQPAGKCAEFVLCPPLNAPGMDVERWTFATAQVSTTAACEIEFIQDEASKSPLKQIPSLEASVSSRKS
eukprot:1139140-Pelagomonas_calceolata.AAC.11